MNWHLYSLSTDRLQAVIAAQLGKVGGETPPLDMFQRDIQTAYIKYWKSRLISHHQVAVARSRHVHLIEQVLEGHNEIFKLYSGIEATLNERAKLLRTIVDEPNEILSAETQKIKLRRISNCDRQAMSIIQRASKLSNIVSWIKDNHVQDSEIMELVKEYEKVVQLGKQTAGEIFTLYADSVEALNRDIKLTKLIISATTKERQAIIIPLREEINWRIFQRYIISSTKEHCLSMQITVLKQMLEVAKIERSRSDASFNGLVSQSNRIKISVLSEPQRALESPVNITFDNTMIWIELADGRIVGAPLKWFPKLHMADKQERSNYKMTPISLIWRSLETQIHMDDLFDGDDNPLYTIDDQS